MITYDNLWIVMKEKGVSTYALIHKYGISSNQINRLKHGEDIKLSTLNTLCVILNCEPSDIISYIPENLYPLILQDKEILYVADKNDRAVPLSISDKVPSEEKPDHGPLSRNLNRLLKAKKMTPRSLANLSGVPLPTIRNIQYGKTKNPHASTLRAIADILEVSISDLITDK